MRKVYDVSEAYEQGAQVADELRISDLFIGAYGEAARYGLKRGTIEWEYFVCGFVDHVPANVTTDKSGRIIQLGYAS